jgi:hypothetical protein
MTRDPDRLIGEIGLAVLASVFLWRIFVWVAQLPTSPDPWGKEIEKALHEPEAVEVCHRCFHPVTPCSWFCEHCGCAVGPYNNVIPYVIGFSQGEVLRNGLNDRLPRNILIVSGYMFFSLYMYLVFAPIYWVLLFGNLKRQNESVEQTGPQQG